MAIPETPPTRENSARDEAIPTIPRRRRTAPPEDIQAPVVEFPSLEDGRRITNQMVGGLIDNPRRVIAQQASTIQSARAEMQGIRTE
ncbi:hypothetical protein BDW60DRAFT_179774 [Aspergillus nidulans var. acristatus]